MGAIVLALLLVLLAPAGCTFAPSGRPPESPFPALDPYGLWYDLPPYGKVWVPTVAGDYRPYGVGRWLWTDRGWFWDSPEPYGWVVYHYGTWVFEGASGWLWVPGYEWSPARVRWMTSGDYVGWAPLLPKGYASQSLNPETVWIVVPVQCFVLDDVAKQRVRSLPTTRSRNPADESRPPDVRMIEQRASRPIVRLRTETENIHTGNRSLTKVRVTGEQVRGDTKQIPPPPPAGQQNPPPAGTRTSGQTRTPPPAGGQKEPQPSRGGQPDTTQAKPKDPRKGER
jgi:Family of unknown function (DUF6600)